MTMGVLKVAKAKLEEVQAKLKLLDEQFQEATTKKEDLEKQARSAAWGFGFKGLGCRVQGLGFRAQGSGLGVRLEGGRGRRPEADHLCQLYQLCQLRRPPPPIWQGRVPRLSGRPSFIIL